MASDIVSAGAAQPATRHRFLVPALVGLLVAQTALLAWVWIIGGRRWPLAPPSAAAVTITSEPAGSAVRVDGRERGATPLTMELAGGRHQLEVGAVGAAWSQVLEVNPGVASALHVVNAAPAAAASGAPETGTLEIATEPSGLEVGIDGVRRGVSPLSVTDLAPGSHDVTVTRGVTTVRRTVTVEAGVPTAVLITTPGNTGIASGWLTVTGPVPVRIQENGTLLGNSEAPRLLLPVGRHDLDFVNDTFGYQSRRTVQIVAGQSATLALEPANGTLSVNAQPWGEVWIDGRRVGETPIGNLPIPIGTHELVVRHPQFGERRRTVSVGVNTPARVGIDLRQPER